MLRIDVVRTCLSNFDLDGLKSMHDNVIKTTIRNKVLEVGQ